MVFVFTGAAYQQVIMEACRETGQMVVGSECREDLYILPYIKENYQKFDCLEYTVIDLSGIKDTDSEIVEALNMLKINNSGNRIIILAAYREPGDSLLAQCFQMSVFDIITTPDYLELKKELMHCIREGKDYKDSVIFREAFKEGGTFRKQKKVDHILIGIAGTQARIGVTHTAVVAANHLRRLGYLVAYEEKNSSGAVNGMADSYRLGWQEDAYIIKGGVDYYKQSGRSGETTGKKAYNFIVRDYGVLTGENLEDFKGCGRRIIIAGAKAWEEKNIQNLFSLFTYEELGELHFYFNFCPAALQNDVKSGMAELKEHVSFTRLAADPFMERELAGLDAILREYLPERQETERKGKRKRK